jgi:hypothetical protein
MSWSIVLVAYPDRTAFFGDFRIAGHSREERIWCRGTFEVAADTTTVPGRWAKPNIRVASRKVGYPAC